MTTGAPAPLIKLASRLLLLSRWSRQTGLAIVIAKGSSAKQSSLRAGAVRRGGLGRRRRGWMPDEDSNLD